MLSVTVLVIWFGIVQHTISIELLFYGTGGASMSLAFILGNELREKNFALYFGRISANQNSMVIVNAHNSPVLSLQPGILIVLLGL